MKSKNQSCKNWNTNKRKNKQISKHAECIKLKKNKQQVDFFKFKQTNNMFYLSNSNALLTKALQTLATLTWQKFWQHQQKAATIAERERE